MGKWYFKPNTASAKFVMESRDYAFVMLLWWSMKSLVTLKEKGLFIHENRVEIL